MTPYLWRKYILNLTYATVNIRSDNLLVQFFDVWSPAGFCWDVYGGRLRCAPTFSGIKGAEKWFGVTQISLLFVGSLLQVDCSQISVR